MHSSDDDRILRDFLNLIEATLRTNFYSPMLSTPGSEVAPTPVLAFKVDPSAGGDHAATGSLPGKFLYHRPAWKGSHLRFGPVARGGLRLV